MERKDIIEGMENRLVMALEHAVLGMDIIF